mmetsp:Transcript_8744/g.36917  ORF Transcript_8744/g.36917 Transcript_8744/m.36917 type:complete len:223 (-) Transcript_8744:1205-1873(-)
MSPPLWWSTASPRAPPPREASGFPARPLSRWWARAASSRTPRTPPPPARPRLSARSSALPALPAEAPGSAATATRARRPRSASRRLCEGRWVSWRGRCTRCRATTMRCAPRLSASARTTPGSVTCATARRRPTSSSPARRSSARSGRSESRRWRRSERPRRTPTRATRPRRATKTPPSARGIPRDAMTTKMVKTACSPPRSTPRATRPCTACAARGTAGARA